MNLRPGDMGQLPDAEAPGAMAPLWALVVLHLGALGWCGAIAWAFVALARLFGGAS